MHYIIGDIHGCFKKLKELYGTISGVMAGDDVLIFLGDYIDRGEESFEVVDYLIGISGMHATCFLKGNHEQMLLDYYENGINRELYFFNGGDRTLQSYRKRAGKVLIPSRHLEFYRSLKLYYEGDNFIAVHAGLNPNINSVGEQSVEDILWIREAFYYSERVWDKTVIFGHTPTTRLGSLPGDIYYDDHHNIIGIDTGAVYGSRLSCLAWPGRGEYQV